MNRRRGLLVGVTALILSGVVTWAVYQAIDSHFRTVTAAERIVVASKRLQTGQRVEFEDVVLASWPKDLKIEGAFHSFDEVVGRGVVVQVWPNEPLVEAKLAPRGAGVGLTTAIPEGMRAVAVKVDEIIGVAGFVLPGTRVDVILSGSPEGGRNRVEMARVILENVEVLAAGQNIERDADGKAQKVQVITLLTSPEDAQKLALAQNDGRIQLALRNPLDVEEARPETVDKASLYDLPKPAPPPRKVVRKKAPSPAPKPPEPVQTQPLEVKFDVELIQGASRETLSFSKKKESGANQQLRQR